MRGDFAARTLAVCVVLFFATALSAEIITSVDRTNGTSGDRDPIGVFDGDTDPLATEAGGLIDGNTVFSDRTYPFANTPAWIQGTEYVRTFNTDKSGTGSDTVNYAVIFSEAVTAFVSIDDRLDNLQGRVDSIVSAFATPGTFSDTGYDLTIRERDDGSRDRAMSIYAASLDAGTYNFGPNPGDKNFHQIGVLPPQPVPLGSIAFSYDTATESGTISGMLDTSHAGGSGDVLFSAPMPKPEYVDPNPTLTPLGDVGTIKEMTGSHNDQGKTVGISWADYPQVELTGNDGVNNYSVLVDLIFGPSGDKGDTGDDPLAKYDPDGDDFLYTFAFDISDEGIAPEDAVTTGDGVRLAVFLAVGKEEPNGRGHRLTQNQYKFVAGEDAVRTIDNDSKTGNAWSKFAAYNDLGLYFGWRDRDTLSGGSFQVESIEFGGLLAVDLESINVTPIPEPSTIVLAAMALLGLGLYGWRKRS